MENVSRAATQRLHVAQPSLSRQIRDLEDEVGVPLLERTARAVRLTDAGRAFLDEARAILNDTKEAVAKARAIGGKRETELHIGDFPLVAARIMPRLLRDYQKAMPNVHVKLHDWPVEKEIAAVREARLQLAIIIPPLTGNWRRELMSMHANVWQLSGFAYRADPNASLADSQNFSAAGLSFPLRQIIPSGTRFGSGVRGRSFTRLPKV